MAEETKKQRVDRELVELLSELRLALPGAQLLFTFLLTVPFMQRFEHVSRTYKNVFFFTFCTTAVSMISLIAPSSHHRLAFRAHDKEELLLRSNAFALVGVLALALSMGGVVFFVTGLAVGEAFALPACIAAFAVIGGFWYFTPIVRRLQNKDRDDGDRE